MDRKTTIDHNDIVFFLEVLLKYCIFYFGEEEGNALYDYYCNNHGEIMLLIKEEKHTYGEKFSKLQLILTKIKSDVFFNKIAIYFVKWPYDKGEVKQVDYELFDLTCFHFYEALGESKIYKEEKLKLGFNRTILDLLLPPKKDCLFNHDERYNKNTALLERLYAELKRRNSDIIQKYGKNFWQLTKDEFSSYIDQKIEKTPQHLINALWYRIKED